MKFAITFTVLFVIWNLVWFLIKCYRDGSGLFFLKCKRYPALATWFMSHHNDAFALCRKGEIVSPSVTRNKLWTGPYKLFVPSRNGMDTILFWSKEPDCQALETEFCIIADDLAKEMQKAWEWAASSPLVNTLPDMVAIAADVKLRDAYSDCLHKHGLP